MENNIQDHKENHNIIEYKGPDGYEEISEFDEYGRYIYFKNNKGVEYRKEYDGNCAHFIYASGFEKWCWYNERNKVEHIKTSTGIDYK